MSNQDESGKKPANNYLKVHPAPFGMSPRLIVPFNDCDPEDTKQAWLLADSIRAELEVRMPRQGFPRYITIYRQPTAWPANVPRPQLIGFKLPRGSDLRLS